MSVSASLKSKISQMMNDGLSNREILKEVNKILKGQGKDTLHYVALNKIINSLMDDLVPTFESDEEDEEYVPSETESEASESEEESEAAESDDESDASEESDEEHWDPINIYLNHPESDEFDRIKIIPENGAFYVLYEYDKSPTKDAKVANAFTTDDVGVLEYIDDIFSLLRVDKKPFTEIEIQVPFYPTISATPASLNYRTRKAILRVLDVYMEHSLTAE